MAPVAVKLTVWPEQADNVLLLIVTVGVLFTVMVIAAEPEQPEGDEPVPPTV